MRRVITLILILSGVASAQVTVPRGTSGDVGKFLKWNGSRLVYATPLGTGGTTTVTGGLASGSNRGYTGFLPFKDTTGGVIRFRTLYPAGAAIVFSQGADSTSINMDSTAWPATDYNVSLKLGWSDTTSILATQYDLSLVSGADTTSLSNRINAKLDSVANMPGAGIGLDGVKSGTIERIKRLKGTANQVTITDNTDSLTFSLPQDIHTAATPTFGLVYLSTLAGAGAGALYTASDGGTYAVNSVSATEIGHLDGVTSAIQTQLDAVRGTDKGGTGLTTNTANQIPYYDGTGTVMGTIGAAAGLGQVLRSTSPPSWDAVQLSGGTVDVSGTLGTANGGTGITHVSATEYGYLVGVTDTVQEQLNLKANIANQAHTGTTSVDSLSVSGGDVKLGGYGGKAHIQLNGDDGGEIGGVFQLYEKAGTGSISSPADMFFAIDNDNNIADAGNDNFKWSKNIGGPLSPADSVIMTLSDLGRLGIGAGNVNPSYNLDVLGTGYVSGDLKVGTLSGTVRATAGVLSATASDTVGLAAALFAKSPLASPTLTGTVTMDALAVGGAAVFRGISPTIVEVGAFGWGVDIYQAGTAGGGQNYFRRADGTEASPTNTKVNMNLGTLSFRGYTGSAWSGTKGQIVAQASENWSATNNGTRLLFYVTPDGSTTAGERLRLSQDGNLGFGQTTFGTSAAKVLAIGNGTAPTTSPADAVQLWSADRGATAGKAGLHIRSEDGTSHVFSDYVGIGTTSPTNALHVKGADNTTIMNIESATSDAGLSGSDVFIAFNDATVTAGSIAGVSAGTIVYNTFTGGHYAQKQTETEPMVEGMLVSATGNLLDDSKTLPMITRTNGRNDKRVYGVYSQEIAPAASAELRDSARTMRALKTEADSLFSLSTHIDSVNGFVKDSLFRVYREAVRSTNTAAKYGGNPLKGIFQVLALGVGNLLVTESGGTITVGDLIASSPTRGLGEKQADDIVHSYTVAKASESVDWTTVPVHPQLGVKVKRIAVTFK